MGWVKDLTLPDGTVTKTFASPLRLDGRGAPIDASPPALGQHTGEIRQRYAADGGQER